MSAKQWNICIECVGLINNCYTFHTDHWRGADRWKKKEKEEDRGGISNKRERRDTSRRNDLKWSQGQGSLWPQAAVFLPTRSDSLCTPPPPPQLPWLFYVRLSFSFPYSSNFTLERHPKTQWTQFLNGQRKLGVWRRKQCRLFTQIDLSCFKCLYQGDLWSWNIHTIAACWGIPSDLSWPACSSLWLLDCVVDLNLCSVIIKNYMGNFN